MRFTVSMKQNHLFRRLYNRGKSAVSRYMAVYCRKNGLQQNRIGYTVSPKIGHAVVRNRIKRRFREIYRLKEPELRCGYDIVIVARSQAADADFAALGQAFSDLAGKLQMIQKEAPCDEIPAP